MSSTLQLEPEVGSLWVALPPPAPHFDHAIWCLVVDDASGRGAYMWGHFTVATSLYDGRLLQVLC
jgi:hypothetical protein